MARQHPVMAEKLLLPYLVALFLLPLLSRWRWSLFASLLATIVTLGLVAVVFYLLEVYRVFPNPYPVGETSGNESPLAQITRSQGYGVTVVVLWVVLPACAALMGGAFAVACSMVLALWRAARACLHRSNSS